MGARRTPAEAKRHVETHTKKVEDGYDIIISQQRHLQPCVLRCKACGEELSPNNPSQTTKQHSTACKRPQLPDEEDFEVEDEEKGLKSMQ
jgi:hypothetical protein